MGLGFTDNLTGDGELGGIFAILAKQIRQKAAAGIDEPVADLRKQTKITHKKGNNNFFLKQTFESYLNKMIYVNYFLDNCA